MFYDASNILMYSSTSSRWLCLRKGKWWWYEPQLKPPIRYRPSSSSLQLVSSSFIRLLAIDLTVAVIPSAVCIAQDGSKSTIKDESMKHATDMEVKA